MIVPLHIVSVALAGGLTGLWVRRMLAALGWLSGFESGILLVAAVAACYIAAQLGFMALLRLLKPTRSPAPLLCDTLAQLAALALVPWLLGVSIPWPAAILHKVEPLLFLGAFGAAQAFLKLVVFFAAMQARPSGRAGALGWAGGAAAALLLAAGAQQGFAHSSADLGAVAAGEPAWTRSGHTWAKAREIREGIGLRILDGVEGRGDLVLLAAPPEGETGGPGSAFVTVAVEAAPGPASGNGSVLPVHTHVIPLDRDGWTELRLPEALLPEKIAAVEVAWSSKPNPEWMRRIGLRPPPGTGHRMQLAGPWRAVSGAGAGAPSIVLLAAEGVGAENTSLLGYSRETTPRLREWGNGAMVFEQAYTPAPDAAAACMTLLTGLHPLRHGYLNGRTGELPPGISTLTERLRGAGYHTAAFTEGRGADGEDLTVDTAFSRGFMEFNDHFPMEAGTPEPGSAAPPKPRPGSARITLDRAAEWAEGHKNGAFFLFVRLRELRTPMRLARYGEGFLGRGRTPSPMDIYDTALLDVDRHIGVFLDRIGALSDARGVVVALASPYGFDFTEPERGSWRRGAAGRTSLHESSLRVPLLFRLPGQPGRSRQTPASLADVLPTLAARAGLAPPKGLDGADLLLQGDFRDLISVQGSPAVLSVRSGRWRFTWQSGLDPFTLELLGDERVVEFVDIHQYRNRQAAQNYLSREPELAREFRRQLEAFLRAHAQVREGGVGKE